MFEHHLLSETFITIKKLDTVSKVNHTFVEKFIKDNSKNSSFLSDNKFSFLKYYKPLPYHQQIQWLRDYIIDHFGAEYHRRIDLKREFLLEQKPGQIINTHNHIDEHELNNSPDFTIFYNISNNKINSELVIEYNDHRFKQRGFYTELKFNKFVIFNSSLNFYISENKNNVNNNYICWQIRDKF